MFGLLATQASMKIILVSSRNWEDYGTKRSCRSVVIHLTWLGTDLQAMAMGTVWFIITQDCDRFGGLLG